MPDREQRGLALFQVDRAIAKDPNGRRGRPIPLGQQEGCTSARPGRGRGPSGLGCPMAAEAKGCWRAR
eukprot:1259477-Lingulodinium_polyedra.AAC.1